MDFMEYFVSGLIGLVIGLLVSILWTIFLYKFKPKLEIACLKLDVHDKSGLKEKKTNSNTQKGLKIKVVNKGCFYALNIKIEACAINEKNETLHFKIDKEDFLMLPPKKKCNKEDNYRSFKITDLSDSAKEYGITFLGLVDGWETGDSKFKKIRVRIHANHSLTGFGKGFQQNFELDDNNRFIKSN